LEGIIVVFIVLLLAEALFKRGVTPKKSHSYRFANAERFWQPPAEDAAAYGAALKDEAKNMPGEASMGSFSPPNPKIGEGSAAPELPVKPPIKDKAAQKRPALSAWQKAIVLREVLGPPGGRGRGYR